MTCPGLYVLDTNICIYIMNCRPPLVERKFDEVTSVGHTVGISSVTLHELWYGTYRSRRVQENAARLQAFATLVDVFPFGDEAAEISGQIRAELTQQGQSIGGLDLLIAGHALALEATVVTRNTREFSRIPGLIYEDWTL